MPKSAYALHVYVQHVRILTMLTFLCCFSDPMHTALEIDLIQWISLLCSYHILLCFINILVCILTDDGRWQLKCVGGISRLYCYVNCLCKFWCFFFNRMLCTFAQYTNEWLYKWLVWSIQLIFLHVFNLTILFLFLNCVYVMLLINCKVLIQQLNLAWHKIWWVSWRALLTLSNNTYCTVSCVTFLQFEHWLWQFLWLFQLTGSEFLIGCCQLLTSSGTSLIQ
jgi:hypothetical protein